MKTLLCVFAILSSLVRMDAAALKLDGDLDWEITEPRCTFTLDGAIQNLSPAGSVSGTIKLVLWATKTPFPGPGFIVAEHTLGQISGGYQFSDFSVKTSSTIPDIDGGYHFTIAILEYTTLGWRTQLVVRTGTELLSDGDFVDQQKWSIPTKKIIAPPASLHNNDVVSLTEKATVLRNRFPFLSREKTKITIGKDSKISVVDNDGKTTGKYNYEVKRSTLKTSKFPSGYLTINHGDSDAQITLFFHTATAGIYKANTDDNGFEETIWGTFSFSSP